MTDKTIRIILSVAVIALIVIAISILESKKPMRAESGGDLAVQESNARIDKKGKIYESAKEVSTPDGFINTSEISISELIGKKVILVDFWTYSCINCQRTIPYLNSWHEKYADEGLVIFGVHTPEFEFEKDYENVKRAVEKFGIKYPVILDNDYSTWTAYRNSYWPRKYLIDIDGFIVYDHIGEGAYEETEKKIVEALNERSQVLGEKEVMVGESSPNVPSVDFSGIKTPEIYLGYSRLQYIANFTSPNCIDKVCDFILPDRVQLNTFVLGGKWRITPESANLEEGPGSIVIRFSANKVNLVAGSPSGPVEAEIYLDGKFTKKVIFGEHDLYNLVDSGGEYGEHLLEIKILNGGLQAFAFTFG